MDQLESNQKREYSLRDLPTQWLILDVEGKILSEDISMMAEEKIAKELMEIPNSRFILAKCHYRIGNDGEKEFITKLEHIPEALKKRPDLEWPFGSPITQIYKYGEPQIDKDGKIKMVE